MFQGPVFNTIKNSDYIEHDISLHTLLTNKSFYLKVNSQSIHSLPQG